MHVTAAATGHGASDPVSDRPLRLSLQKKSLAAMTNHPKIFELLKDFMDADSRSERWITVQEFRTFFHLKTSCSPVISGYFRRLYQNPTYLCPYRVIRIGYVRDPANPYRSVKRYLVEKTPRVPGIDPQRGIRNAVIETPVRMLNR